jgi:hypothetical protein
MYFVMTGFLITDFLYPLYILLIPVEGILIRKFVFAVILKAFFRPQFGNCTASVDLVDICDS